MRKRPLLVYLCNAFEEKTCREREINSDSPAASKKVFQISAALKSKGVSTIVLTMGRGRQNGTWSWHSAKTVRFEQNLIVYAPYFDAPILTHLVSLLGLAKVIWRLRRGKNNQITFLAYNRLPYYLVSLIFARIIGAKCFLDLEDGDILTRRFGVKYLIKKARILSIDFLCNAGAILATSSLSKYSVQKNTLCCYGVAKASGIKNIDWDDKLQIHLGGTLDYSTGANLFIDAVKILRKKASKDLRNVEFVVTGKGDMAGNINALTRSNEHPLVKFFGSVSNRDYKDLKDASHIGLCLKLGTSALGDSTFPSKVIDITSSGLCLLTTRVSDVPKIFANDEVIYLNDEEPETLANKFLWALKNKNQIKEIAKKGQIKALKMCSQDSVGDELKKFLFPMGGEGSKNEFLKK